MKKKLLIPLIALCLGFSNCNQNISSQIKTGKPAGTFYYVDRVSAEKQMHLLAKTDSLEDMWLYAENKLIDIGYNESRDSVRIDIGVFFKFIADHYPADIFQYHTHPLIDALKKFKVSPPSPPDFVSRTALKNMLKEKYPKLKLKSFVFDGFGKWEYSLDKYWAKAFAKSDLDNKKFLHFNLYVTDFNNFTETFLNESLSNKEKINKYIEKSSKKGINLKYTPLGKNKKRFGFR